MNVSTKEINIKRVNLTIKAKGYTNGVLFTLRAEGKP